MSQPAISVASVFDQAAMAQRIVLETPRVLSGVFTEVERIWMFLPYPAFRMPATKVWLAHHVLPEGVFKILEGSLQNWSAPRPDALTRGVVTAPDAVGPGFGTKRMQSAPRSEISSALARPIPRLPPQIRAVLPFKDRSVRSSLFC